MLRSKLHDQKVFRFQLFSYELTCTSLERSSLAAVAPALSYLLAIEEHDIIDYDSYYLIIVP
jgi:hypothetical protein